MHIAEKLKHLIQEKNSCLLLGLDPNWEKMPDFLREGVSNMPDQVQAMEEFCVSMIEASSDFICGVKIQMAYFEVLGSQGVALVERLIKYAQKKDLFVLIDGKRNDIGSTCDAYAQSVLGKGVPLEADGMTVSPFLGIDGILPFLNQVDSGEKFIFILAKTSNPSAPDTQLEIVDRINESIDWKKIPMSRDGFYNVGYVFGATKTDELGAFRNKNSQSWILAPGVGAQGGDIDSLLSHRTNDGQGILIPISRSVLYASKEKDFSEAGRTAIKTFWEQQKI